MVKIPKFQAKNVKNRIEKYNVWDKVSNVR